MKIILASGSPRRKEILGMLGLEYEAISADIDESVLPGESPYDYVHRLAINKALEVEKQLAINSDEKRIIIGGDITIDLDGKALAKPEDRADAKKMISSLLGRNHAVRDGFAIVLNGEIYNSGVVSVNVAFKDVTDQELEAYLDVGDWEGKAGAYAIQGAAADYLATSITGGGYFNFLGLAVYQIIGGLIAAGVDIDPQLLLEMRKYDREKISSAVRRL